MDIWSKDKRSEVMALVKSKNTKPEILVRKHLFSLGYRYRINVKNLPGKPDIVLPKYKTIIFVHGCFWHGHKINGKYHRKIPQSNTEFWQTKIKNNAVRDIQNQKDLEEAGWRVFIIWECELSSKSKRKEILEALLKFLGEYSQY